MRFAMRLYTNRERYLYKFFLIKTRKRSPYFLQLHISSQNLENSLSNIIYNLILSNLFYYIRIFSLFSGSMSKSDKTNHSDKFHHVRVLSG